MKISSMLIYILLFGAFMTVMGSFYTNFQNSYNYTGTNISTYDYSADFSDETSSMGDSIKSGTGILTSLTPYFGAMLNTFKSLVDLPTKFSNMISSINEGVGLPNWTITFVNSVIVIIVGFGIGSIVWRWEM